MKLMILSATMALLLTTAAAMAFSFPAHEPDGYRGTGCDASAQQTVTNDAGQQLYSNNPTCPEGGEGIARTKPAAPEEDPEDPDEGTDPDDGEGDGDTGDEGDGPGDGDTSGEGDGPGEGGDTEGDGDK